MARPPKVGLSYFSLDVDVFEDDKLFDIQNQYGCLGESIYFRLLSYAYKENGYYYEFGSEDRLAAKLIKSIGNKWASNKQTVIQVVRAIVDAKLIDKTLYQSNVITSVGIQKRYLKACERRRSMNIVKYRLIETFDEACDSADNNPDYYSNNPDYCDNNASFCGNNDTESKRERERKESKEKNDDTTLDLNSLDCFSTAEAEAIRAAFEQSSWLRDNITSTAWVKKNLGKIKSGYYRDFGQKSKEPEDSGYTADALDDLVTHLTDDD